MTCIIVLLLLTDPTIMYYYYYYVLLFIMAVLSMRNIVFNVYVYVLANLYNTAIIPFNRRILHVWLWH